jgi:hypothetical protein
MSVWRVELHLACGVGSHHVHEAAHADSRPGIESVVGFLPTKSEQARREVIGWQSTEPAAFVVRSIPGDVRERRESH